MNGPGTVARDKPVSWAERHKEAILTIRQRISEATGRVSRIADQAFGPEPEALATGKGVELMPSASLPELESLLEEALEATQQLHREISRLENIV